MDFCQLILIIFKLAHKLLIYDKKMFIGGNYVRNFY